MNGSKQLIFYTDCYKLVAMNNVNNRQVNTTVDSELDSVTNKISDLHLDRYSYIGQPKNNIDPKPLDLRMAECFNMSQEAARCILRKYPQTYHALAGDISIPPKKYTIIELFNEGRKSIHLLKYSKHENVERIEDIKYSYDLLELSENFFLQILWERMFRGRQKESSQSESGENQPVETGRSE